MYMPKNLRFFFLVSDGGEMSFEQAGKDDDWRGSAGQLG